MVKSAKASSITLRQLIFWFAIFALIVSFSLLILEKSGTSNFYTKSNVTTTAGPANNEVNKVDYSTPSNTVVDEGNIIKEEAAKQGSQSTQNSSLLSISLSAAGQDTPGGPIIIRTIVNGASSGECVLNIKGGAVSESFTSNLLNTGTYTTCKGFDVPVDAIPAGQYTATVTVTSGGKTGTIGQAFGVTK